MDRYSEAEMTKIARAEFKRGKLLMIDDEIEFLEELMHHDIGINANVGDRLSALQKLRSELK